jgi:hypothetical protein
MSAAARLFEGFPRHGEIIMRLEQGLFGLKRPLLLVSLVVSFLLGFPAAQARLDAQEFLRGDANTDGRVSISDVLTIRRFLFGGIEIPCMDAADADDGQPVDGCNCSPAGGKVQVGDAIALLRYLFIQEGWSSILPEPFPLPAMDPTPDEAGCGSYELVPPVATQDVIRVGEVEGAPGSEVEIPIYLSNSADIDAVQLVIEYDPLVFTPIEGAEGISYEGTFYEQFESPRGEISIVKAHPDAGVFVAGIVGSLHRDTFAVPPGVDTLIARIRGTVSPSAPPGTLILAPTNGPDGEGVGPYMMRNEVTHQGEARFATTLPQRIAGLLKIVGPDVVDFLRGDSNSDGRFDLSDAAFTLAHLFREGPAPLCIDAADTNDDGRLNLTDPVAGLNFLFAPSRLESPLSVIPGTCGPDIEADSLDPCSSPACP